MLLKLIRTEGTEEATEGKLYVNGEFECYTLEDVDRKLEKDGTKVYGKTAIPRGTYNVTWSMSNRFKKYMPEVLDVPGFKGIRIHAGNSSEDTEGCILLGAVNASDKDNWISSSRAAIDNFYPKIEAAYNSKEPIVLEIV